MKRVVKIMHRKPDGTYEQVDPKPMPPRPDEDSESKRLRELAGYGNMLCRIKYGRCWYELRCVPAGTYTISSGQLTIPETYIVVSENVAFLLDSQRYARELKMCRQGADQIKVTTEQQLMQLGTPIGTIQWNGVHYEGWHISAGEYMVNGRPMNFVDTYIGIGQNGMIVVPGEKIYTVQA